MAKESSNLEEEANSPVKDDNDSPVSEPPFAEDEDPRSCDWEAFRGFERDQLRRRLTWKQPRRVERRPELSPEEEEEMERLKKARVNVSELLHDAFP